MRVVTADAISRKTIIATVAACPKATLAYAPIAPAKLALCKIL
jgi:hypothetical protein